MLGAVNKDHKDVVACDNIIDHVLQDQTWDRIWKFCKITCHKKVGSSTKKHKKTGINLLVKWEMARSHGNNQTPVTKEEFTMQVCCCLCTRKSSS